MLLAAGSAFAAPPWSVEECVAASDEGQRLQRASALLAAKQQLEICAHLSCPAVVQAACTRWLDEVLTATPSLIIVARVDGADQARVQVRLDGQPWLDELNGKPQPVDPGEHRVTVVVDGPPLEQRLVVNLGEKNRLVVFQLQSPAAGAAAFVASTPAAPAPPLVPLAAAAPPRSAPVLPVVLSAAAVAGFAGFTGLGLMGRSTQQQLVNAECAKTKSCSPASVADVQRLYGAADVALAVGVVSAGLAIWRWVAWALPPGVTVAPVVHPAGPGLVVGGRW